MLSKPLFSGSWQETGDLLVTDTKSDSENIKVKEIRTWLKGVRDAG
jgi:hypothetical protein